MGKVKTSLIYLYLVWGSRFLHAVPKVERLKILHAKKLWNRILKSVYQKKVITEEAETDSKYNFEVFE